MYKLQHFTKSIKYIAYLCLSIRFDYFVCHILRRYQQLFFNRKHIQIKYKLNRFPR